MSREILTYRCLKRESDNIVKICAKRWNRCVKKARNQLDCASRLGLILLTKTFRKLGKPVSAFLFFKTINSWQDPLSLPWRWRRWKTMACFHFSALSCLTSLRQQFIWNPQRLVFCFHTRGSPVPYWKTQPRKNICYFSRIKNIIHAKFETITFHIKIIIKKTFTNSYFLYF